MWRPYAHSPSLPVLCWGNIFSILHNCCDACHEISAIRILDFLLVNFFTIAVIWPNSKNNLFIFYTCWFEECSILYHDCKKVNLCASYLHFVKTMEPGRVALGHSRSCEGEHRACSAMSITLGSPPVQEWLTEAQMYTQKLSHFFFLATQSYNCPL